MSVREQIVSLLKHSGVSFEEFNHEPCASSVESAHTRRKAGAGDTVGAKALLLKSKSGGYTVCVIPGSARLDSKKLRSIIGKHSFASSEEMEAITGGLKPGHMPPFGPQLFENITHFIIDLDIQRYNKIGFNAGDPTVSIVLSGNDYLKVCGDTFLLDKITS